MEYQKYSKMTIAGMSLILSLSGYSSERVNAETDDATLACAQTPATISNILKKQSLFTQEELRVIARRSENEGDIYKAANYMDCLLKNAKKTNIGDLCYALDLNKQINQVNRQNRAIKIMRRITQHLDIRIDQEEVKLPLVTWSNLRPYLEMLVNHTSRDSSVEKRNFHYKIYAQDFEAYHSWWLKFMGSYHYPLSIGFSNLGGKKGKDNGEVYVVSKRILHFTNHTKKEQEARETFAYHFHGGGIDESKLNPVNFYNLMVRAGFCKEDFAKGQYGFQDKVFVKPFQLSSDALDEGHQEFMANLSSALKKAIHPYVVTVGEIPSKALYNISDLYTYNSNEIAKKEGCLATIIAPEEHRIYLCFFNSERQLLDLHGMSAEEALKETFLFIQERYNNFDKSCTVITGRGNHVAPNGAKGMLFNSVKKWVKRPELKLLISSINPISGNGGYKVKLVKASEIVLKGPPSQSQHREDLATSILKEAKQGRNRLVISSLNYTSEDLLSVTTIAIMSLFKNHCLSATMKPLIVNDKIHLKWYQTDTGNALIFPSR